MPQETNRTEQWDAPIDVCYKTLIDYSAYPHFVPGVEALEVLSQDEQGASVRYSINMIKKFQYTLKLSHLPPQRVSWALESGNLFKENNGSWDLKDMGDGKTQVIYSLSVEFNRFVPQTIVKSLVRKQLPSMMKVFHQKVLENLP